jgi:small redox-active disulfide protein 2
MKIEIFGPGCPKCKETERRVREVLKELNIEAEVVHVSDINEMTKRGIFLTPAVLIDGEVKISGKVPSLEELRNILS